MKRLFCLLCAVIVLLSFASCKEKKQEVPAGSGDTVPDDTTAVPEKEVPDDFSFSVVWGVCGISSYHSDTGKLTKTTDTLDGNKDKFVAELHLDKETTKRFYQLITSLDLLSYPSEYDPGCGYSDPPAKLMLSYTANGKTYRVTCSGISLDYRVADNEKGQAFLNVLNQIVDYLVETPEWKALPDYELLYE